MEYQVHFEVMHKPLFSLSNVFFADETSFLAKVNNEKFTPVMALPFLAKQRSGIRVGVFDY